MLSEERFLKSEDKEESLEELVANKGASSGELE
jgi:hypothetical protein